MRKWLARHGSSIADLVAASIIAVMFAFIIYAAFIENNPALAPVWG